MDLMDKESILAEVNLFETEKGVPTGVSASTVHIDAGLPLWESVKQLLPKPLASGDHTNLKCYITESEDDRLKEVELSLIPKESTYLCTADHPALFMYYISSPASPSTPQPNSQNIFPSFAETTPPPPLPEPCTAPQSKTTKPLIRIEDEQSDKGEAEERARGHYNIVMTGEGRRKLTPQHTPRPQHRLSLQSPTSLEANWDQGSRLPWSQVPSPTPRRVQKLTKSLSTAEDGRLKRAGCQVKRKSSIDTERLLSFAQVINAATNATSITNINTLWTIKDLKKSIASELCLTYDFDLTYEYDGIEFQLFDDLQILCSSYLCHLWLEGCRETPIVVKPHHQTSQSDGLALKRISRITGVRMERSVHGDTELQCIADGDMPEVVFARRVLHSFVSDIIHKRDAAEYSLSMELESRAVTTVLALKIPSDMCIEVNFHWKQSFTLTRRTSVRSNADDALAEVFPCLVACKMVEESSTVEDYTLAVTGEMSYISGKTELLAFKTIRRCIFKGEPIHLSLVRKPSLSLDRPLDLSWIPIDPYTGSVTIDQKTMDNIGSGDTSSPVLYLPMIKSNFNITLIKAENLPLGSPLVSVKITLYHGHVPLCSPVSSEPAPLEDQGWAAWNETLQLDIPVGHIPRDAKLMISVCSLLHHDDRAPCCLYWGLMSIIDYRSELVQGKVVRRLWRTSGLSKLNGGGFECNPLAPSSNSPEPDAVEVTFLMQLFSKSVFHPYYCRKNKFQDFARLFSDRQLNGFPGYVAGINWNSPEKVDELYSVLGYLDNPTKIAQFPKEQALKLLDCEYCDEQVRSFATMVLEKLPDDQLEDILLQLTQALKFESYHTSTLARFLLKRALGNKKIGHFFFWYLRCELYNPQHVPRFATILEAYLLGCGESMMAGFEAQLEMQGRIEAMATELKEKCKNDPVRMQEMLPHALKAIDATRFTFISPYNPRIMLGDLQLKKCKIMGSKAKPIWLEMMNKDENALMAPPVRLILKMRDDLRQDMITLKMFSLFEKLWEEEGLELHLIPYGCIATGSNGGFIEVVKNSKTIAEVSAIKNDKKLFEWIRSHQTNDYGEIDEDKVKAAIQRFISSCAGYSVATYVLGIGDRHNDNVMVTTSGNLFHIDFGHFLGNIKHCMGFKREWVPFVLTPDFVYVMGGEGSKTFESYKDLCCKAFLKLRRHANLIVNLFSMMRSTGIPELRCVQDLDHVRKALAISAHTETEAQEEFLEVLKKCLDLKWTVQMMWKIHNMAKKS